MWRNVTEFILYLETTLISLINSVCRFFWGFCVGNHASVNADIFVFFFQNSMPFSFFLLWLIPLEQYSIEIRTVDILAILFI